MLETNCFLSDSTKPLLRPNHGLLQWRPKLPHDLHLLAHCYCLIIEHPLAAIGAKMGQMTAHGRTTALPPSREGCIILTNMLRNLSYTSVMVCEEMNSRFGTLHRLFERWSLN
jgi:hypothetical protein